MWAGPICGIKIILATPNLYLSRNQAGHHQAGQFARLANFHEAGQFVGMKLAYWPSCIHLWARLAGLQGPGWPVWARLAGLEVLNQHTGTPAFTYEPGWLTGQFEPGWLVCKY
ncbi:hypothetical protein C8R48DRAFT_679578 [Suillus tomentosus]|nr:hypothetical protein C8R48DRAFT_679578 [Suillus tomentosus]